MKIIRIKTFTLSLILVLFLNFEFAYAQSQDNFSYQAVIRDGSGELAVSSNIGMQISILEGSETGNAVYVERHFPTTNANGLVTIEIGTGTVTSGNFENIDWGGNTHFITTETDINGGSNYDMSATSQLLSVPYAINAQSVSRIEDGQIEINHLSIENAEEGDILRFNGSEWERVSEAFTLEGQNTITTDKNLDIDGQIQNTEKTGQANLVPIAYGVIRNEEISTGTGNFILSKGSNPSSGDYYDINIQGENFIYYDYITQVTPVREGTVRATSNNGQLRIYIYNRDGNSTYSDFNFVVYKP